MEEIIVYGDNPLKGTVEIEGAKNAVLPILAASLLAEDGTTRLSNVPILSDVFTMKEVIHHLNAQVDFNLDKKEITVNASSPLEVEAPYEYVSKMRASIVVLGPLLARNGHAKVAMPGGCAIGKRPIDLHLKGFQALGATIHQRNGYIEAVADQLEGNSIYLDFPSVGATQNIMMAAVKAKGTTTIDNVAREPEIVDLANLLNKMGAKIHGAGTETIRIEGVEHLYAVQHAIVQDRIEAGTFMVAGAMPNNDLFIKDAIAERNRPLLSKLKEMGAEITETEDGIQIKGPEQLQPTDVKTLPHPGFPTDMQAQTSVLQLLANGTSVTTETVFENRFQHLEEMRKMNAHMKIDGNVAIMQGNDSLQGGVVYATDLRAAAALVLAGLKAEGITRVRNLKYLDRGYYHFHEKLQKLGANIERVSDNSVKEEVHV